jgi:tetratricopeptide (TPR) repeat protein
MRQRDSLTFATALALSAFAAGLGAQCPDGSAPPCAAQRVAARRAPPLDDRTWIVLPFTNISRDVPLDWVGPASVGLLSADMSRWTDLRVVDDERVSELLGEVPVAERAQIGLATGLSIAKRAGAGTLVIGDYVTQGTRTSLTAKVYNVRTGERIRTVPALAASPDSIVAAYQALAARVVDVPPPSGTTLNGIGTSNAQAVREYALGMQARNRTRADSAEAHFARAVELDSTFALAHMRLSTILRNSGSAANAQRARTEYDAAVRHSAALPERERILIAVNGYNVALAVRCNSASRLLALDSADAEGWRQRGQCEFLNLGLATGADGGVYRQGSVNAAAAAYERSLDLRPDPTVLTSLLNIYTSAFDLGVACAVKTTPCPRMTRYWGIRVFEGDSIASRYEPLVRWWDPPWGRRATASARRALQVAGRDVAARWAATLPQNLYAHGQYSWFLMRLGNFASAERELNAAADLARQPTDANRFLPTRYRAVLALKREDFAGADTLFASLPGAPELIAFGKFDGAARIATPEFRAILSSYYAVFAGVVRPNFEQSLDAYAKADSARRQGIVEVGTTLAFHTTRRRATADTASAFPLFRFQAFLGHGDTSRARQALAAYDSLGNDIAEDYWNAHEVFSAESHAALGDTLGAWVQIEPFARRFSTYDVYMTAFWDPLTFGTDNSPLYRTFGVFGRAWLLYADLALATGHREEAKRGYRAVVGMWQNGDAPVQPLVQRAREALAKLGG